MELSLFPIRSSKISSTIFKRFPDNKITKNQHKILWISKYLNFTKMTLMKKFQPIKNKVKKEEKLLKNKVQVMNNKSKVFNH